MTTFGPPKMAQVYEDLSRAVNRVKQLCSREKVAVTGFKIRTRGRPKGSKDSKPRKKKTGKNSSPELDSSHPESELTHIPNSGISSIYAISLALRPPSTVESPASICTVNVDSYLPQKQSDNSNTLNGPYPRTSIHFLLD